MVLGTKARREKKKEGKVEDVGRVAVTMRRTRPTTPSFFFEGKGPEPGDPKKEERKESEWRVAIVVTISDLGKCLADCRDQGEERRKGKVTR